MAIKLENKTNVLAPNVTYPFGNIKDNTGSNDGTPVNTATYADFHQFFAKMLFESGVVANGLPDNQANGFQYYEALLALFGGLRTKVVQIGDWNMDANPSVEVSTDIAASKVRSVDGVIYSDSGLATALSGTLTENEGYSTGLNVKIGIIQNNSIKLFRSGTGEYDNNTFDSTSFNRGFLVIRYVP